MTLLDHARELVADGKMDWAQLDYGQKKELIGKFLALCDLRFHDPREIFADAINVTACAQFGKLLYEPEAEAIDWRDQVGRLLVKYADKHMQDTFADLFERAVYEERQARADSAREEAAERRRDEAA